MNTTLHKLLCHSAAVVEQCLLPLGVISEEEAKSRNKRLQHYRLRHTRKDKRVHTMSDLVGYLLVASDPLLSSHGPRHCRSLHTNRHGLVPETLQLLEKTDKESDTDSEGGEESDSDGESLLSES